MKAKIGNLQAGTSICSIAACCTLLLIFFAFPELRKKSFISTVYFICLSDFLSSIGYALGPIVESNSSACWAQGILANIFTLSSVLWTTVICWMMYYILIKGKLFRVNRYCHLICWGLPTLVSVLPLINSTYGFQFGYVCWIKPAASTPRWGQEFWRWFSYYGIIWASLGIDTVLLILIRLQIRKLTSQSSIETTASVEVIFKVLRKLCWYPAIVLILYGETCFSDMVYSQSQASSESKRTLTIVTAVVPCLAGLCNSIAFWISNSDLRAHCWQHLWSSERHLISLPDHFFDLGSPHLLDSGKEVIKSLRNNISKIVPLAVDLERGLERAGHHLIDSTVHGIENSTQFAIHTLENLSDAPNRVSFSIFSNQPGYLPLHSKITPRWDHCLVDKSMDTTATATAVPGGDRGFSNLDEHAEEIVVEETETNVYVVMDE